MAQHRDSGIQRIKLSNGNWADVRTRLTVGDVRHQQTEAHSRGYANETLDGLSLLPRLITQWSYGDAVTVEGIDALDANDAMAILGAVNVQQNGPNPSSPSSDGTDGGASPTPDSPQENGS